MSYQAVPELDQDEYEGFKDATIRLNWRTGSLLRIKGSGLKPQDEQAAGVLMSLCLDNRVKWAPVGEAAVIELCKSRKIDKTLVFIAIERLLTFGFLRAIDVRGKRYFILSATLVRMVVNASETQTLHDIAMR